MVNQALNVRPLKPERPLPKPSPHAVVATSTALPHEDNPRLAPFRRLSSVLGGMVLLLRPRQWLKNGLILLAPVITAPSALAHRSIPLLLTVLAFVTAASMVYVFNDLWDRERDRLHPVKCRRPLASGRVGVPAAVGLLVVLGTAMVFWIALLPPQVGLTVGGYLAVNIWYCLALKHQPLVDVCIVASGFVLRTVAGSIAAGIELRPSLLICVYCACLAMSLGKRRHELARLQHDPVALGHRPTLAAYSVPFLDLLIAVNLVVTLTSYVGFVWIDVQPHGASTAALTFPFAAFAVARYLQLVTLQDSGGDPVKDLSGDRALLVNGLLWIAVLVAGRMW